MAMGRSGLPGRPRARTGPADRVDDTGCHVVHVDMDAFFASVEVRRRPELRGRPVIVGGVGNRGVVTSATYEARAYGVRSAMPVAHARRLCPAAVVLPGDFAAYAEASARILEIFRSVTPAVESLSLDEAFLDVSGAVRRLGSPGAIGQLIRDRVAGEQGLTCSVGIAPTKFVAKLATTLCKPDGRLVVPADGVLEFLHPLPVSALSGVGERTDEQLARLGLRTVGDVARTPVSALRAALGSAGGHLHELSWGHDSRRVVAEVQERTTGAEQTFSHDIDDRRVAHRELLRLARRTAARLRRHGTRARTVSIKVRFSDFRTITRSRTLSEPTDLGKTLYDVARGLFDELGPGLPPLRLLGVRAEGLRPAETTGEQFVLGAPEHGWRDAELATDRVSLRFGREAVGPASLIMTDRHRATEDVGPGVRGRTGGQPRPPEPGRRAPAAEVSQPTRHAERSRVAR